VFSLLLAYYFPSSLSILRFRPEDLHYHD